MASNDTNNYDVFISYQWDVKASVLKLYEQLTKVHNLRCWMDVYNMGSGDLYDSKYFMIRLFIGFIFDLIEIVNYLLIKIIGVLKRILIL